MACYKSEALSDAKRAVCLNPEWEKVSIKHGCLSTNLSPIIIYTCSSFSFASWRRNAAHGYMNFSFFLFKVETGVISCNVYHIFF